ncbi:D-alanyl-D-alanine carboxypeptidase family protein [Cellulomonas sp. Marseille-Q8402]
MANLTHVGGGAFLAPDAAVSYLHCRRDGAPEGITTAWRSREFQAQLYAAFLAGTGALASKPGTSKHEVGMGLDIPDEGENPRDWFERRGHAYGWVRTNREAWHFEYRPRLDEHVSDAPIALPLEADVSLTPAEAESLNECRRMLGVLLGWTAPAPGSPEVAALALLRGGDTAQQAAAAVVNHENITEPRRMIGALLGWNDGTGPEPDRIAKLTGA